MTNKPVPNERGEYRLVVVHRHVTDEVASEVFPGWRVVRPGDAMGGLKVGYLLILCKPETECERVWFDLNLAMRIRPKTIVRNFS